MALDKYPTTLLVDDSPASLLIFSRVLQARGFLVETASSGAEAMEALRQRAFGLILVDLLMPGLDGLEICRWLSLHPQRAEFKVILCSGCDEEEVIQNGLQSGADAYLIKNGTPEDLAQRLEALLSA